MAEVAVVPKKPSLWQRIAQNPVVLKELRGRMRGGRAFVILTLYLLLTSAMIALVYLGFYFSSNTVFGAPDIRRNLGKGVFFAVVGMELMMICFIAPALTAGAISAERERQTFDLLRTTLLSARSLVLGKLASSLSFIWLMLLAGIPFLSLAYLFGGVALEEVAVALLLLFVSSIFFSALGMFFSSLMKRTLAPTVLSYALTILLVFALPTVLLVGLGFYSGMYSGSSTWSRELVEIILFGGAMLLVSLNPVAAAAISEAILMNDQSLFYSTVNLPSGTAFPVISPWIIFTVLYLLLSFLMIVLSIHFVRRAEK